MKLQQLLMWKSWRLPLLPQNLALARWIAEAAWDSNSNLNWMICRKPQKESVAHVGQLHWLMHYCVHTDSRSVASPAIAMVLAELCADKAVASHRSVSAVAEETVVLAQTTCL